MDAPFQGWAGYGLAFAVFFATHMIPARPRLRARLTRAIGERAYLTLYGLVSALVLAWLIAAAGRAPYIPLWPETAWTRWVPNLLMPPAILLAVFGIGAPNPLSIASRKTGFDPARPGIAGLTRHPLLWALALWALGHLIANGDLAHVILFGLFAGFALLGMVLIDRRRRRMLGEETWRRLAACCPALPFAALVTGRWRPRGWPHPGRLLLAAAIWAVLLWLHPLVIGTSPLPA